MGGTPRGGKARRRRGVTRLTRDLEILFVPPRKESLAAPGCWRLRHAHYLLVLGVESVVLDSQTEPLKCWRRPRRRLIR